MGRRLLAIAGGIDRATRLLEYLATALLLVLVALVFYNVTSHYLFSGSSVLLAALIALNLQTSFLTPPFGWALFFLKGAAPPAIDTRMIYRGVIPFIAIQCIALCLLFLVPTIATWLPEAIGR